MSHQQPDSNGFNLLVPGQAVQAVAPLIKTIEECVMPNMSEMTLWFDPQRVNEAKTELQRLADTFRAQALRFDVLDKGNRIEIAMQRDALCRTTDLLQGEIKSMTSQLQRVAMLSPRASHQSQSIESR